MADTYWFKQEADKPLFPDLLWSRPETKARAGKLLIVGGNKFGFAAPAAAYAAAETAGIGTTKVYLPGALKSVVEKLFPAAEFGPSTPSGSFSRPALADLLEHAQWADAVMLAGDFGRNSETAVMLDRFLAKYKGPLTAQHDAIDYFWHSNSPLINRPKTTSIINLGKLQRLAKNNRPSTPILHNMLLKDLVDILHDWTTANPGQIITKHADNFVAAGGGQVLTTTSTKDSSWQVELGAYTSVWQLQQPAKAFEALSCAVYEYA